MGRQIKFNNPDLAYIAGFLDGDGSLMVQLKKRKDTQRGLRLMFTICFYQDTRHEKPLFWIRKKLGIGYISRRNDGITELRINGYKQTKEILERIYPYIKFKKKQARYLLKILRMLDGKELFRLSKQERQKIAKAILKVREETYQSGLKTRKKLKSDLRKIIQG